MRERFVWLRAWAMKALTITGAVAVLVLLLALVGGCRSPRQPPVPAESRERGSSRTTTRSEERPAAAPAASQTVPAAAMPDGGCTIALLLADGMLDCTFSTCPLLFAATLTSARVIRLGQAANGENELTVERTSPPFTPMAAAKLRWPEPAGGPVRITVLEDDVPAAGQCTPSGSLLSGAAAVVPIDGLTVRRKLPDR
jgi:hypothetical protein